MASTPKKSGWLYRFARRFFEAPFQDLPAEFGDPVPPELRVFEAEAESAQHSPQREQTHPGPQDASPKQR
jgi:hypothetical protein